MHGTIIVTDHLSICQTELILDDRCYGLIETNSKFSSSTINTSNILYDLNLPIDKLLHIFGPNIYVYYYYNGKYYVDLYHLLSAMLLTESEFTEKLQLFLPEVSFSVWMLRNNSTYVQRNLIDLSVMNKIILSTDNYFSNNYRKECLSNMIAIYVIVYYLFMIYCVLKFAQ